MFIWYTYAQTYIYMSNIKFDDCAPPLHFFSTITHIPYIVYINKYKVTIYRFHNVGHELIFNTCKTKITRTFSAFLNSFFVSHITHILQ